jgi:hypothetical protein
MKKELLQMPVKQKRDVMEVASGGTLLLDRDREFVITYAIQIANSHRKAADIHVWEQRI